MHLNLLRREVAAIIGVSRQTVVDWERAKQMQGSLVEGGAGDVE